MIRIIYIMEHKCDPRNLDGDNQLAGTVETMLYMGDHSECYMRSDCGEIVALRPNGTIHAEDHPVAIRLPQDAVRIWP